MWRLREWWRSARTHRAGRTGCGEVLASDLGERHCVEHHQVRGRLGTVHVEHHGDDHPVVLGGGTGPRHEHRLAGKRTRRGPVDVVGVAVGVVGVDLDQPIVEPTGRIEAVAVHVSVRLHAAPVVEPGHLDDAVADHVWAHHRATVERHAEPAQLRGWELPAIGAEQRVEATSIDGRCVVVGGKIEHELAVFLVGVGEVEREHRRQVEPTDDPAGLAVDEVGGGGLLAMPRERADERPPEERVDEQLPRVAPQRKGSEHCVPLADPEAVHP